MNITDELVNTQPSSLRPGMSWPSEKPQRPSFRWSDIWKAPLHDFPIRDEILYQYLPLSPTMEVLEIGLGSGFTAFRLARQVRQLTLVEIAAEVITMLREQLRHVPNIQYVCADLSQPGLVEQTKKQDFDAVFGLDVLEYVVDPAICLRNLREVLRPGGKLLLTYPNVPPPLGDGVTYFSQVTNLENLLRQADFHSWQIFVVLMRPYAARVYRVLHHWPLHLCRRLRSGHRTAHPQIYRDTWAFQNHRKLLRYKIALHLLWAALGQVIRLGGDIFAAGSARGGILGQQIVIQARR